MLIIMCTSCNSKSRSAIKEHNDNKKQSDTLNFPVDTLGRVIHYKSTNLENGADQLVQYHQPINLTELVYLVGDTVLVSFSGEINNTDDDTSYMHVLTKVLH